MKINFLRKMFCSLVLAATVLTAHSISFLLLTVCLLFLPSAAWADGIVSELTLSLSTDKACYAPGSTVTFTAVGDLPSGKEGLTR